jgi:hypothetical protein
MIITCNSLGRIRSKWSNRGLGGESLTATESLSCERAGTGEVMPRCNVGGIDRFAGIGLFRGSAPKVGGECVLIWIQTQLYKHWVGSLDEHGVLFAID